MRADVSRLIDAGNYSAALMAADFSEDGYWPDERYDSRRRNVQECLEMIEIDRRIKASKQPRH
jgi:hypothetical protein